MTTDPGLIQSTYWVHGDVSVPRSGNNIIMGAKLKLYVGVNMRLSQVDCSEASNSTECEAWYGRPESIMKRVEGKIFHYELSWSDENACRDSAGYGATIEEQAASEKVCKDCQNALISNFALILGVVTQVPTITTNFQRCTAFGDVNCQATMGFLTCVWGLFNTMLSIILFSQACHKNLPESVGEKTIAWSHGFGFWCLIVGILIKVPDAVGHLVVPTPPKRWQKPAGKISSVVEYMRLDTVPEQQGMEDKAPPAEELGREAATAQAPAVAPAAAPTPTSVAPAAAPGVAPAVAPAAVPAAAPAAAPGAKPAAAPAAAQEVYAI